MPDRIPSHPIQFAHLHCRQFYSHPNQAAYHALDTTGSGSDMEWAHVLVLLPWSFAGAINWSPSVSVRAVTYVRTLLLCQGLKENTPRHIVTRTRTIPLFTGRGVPTAQEECKSRNNITMATNSKLQEASPSQPIPSLLTGGKWSRVGSGRRYLSRG